MNILGLKNEVIINDMSLLKDMKEIIFHDGDVRPVWIGGGIAKTDVIEFSPYANWSNEHWSIYYSFFDDIDNFKSKNILDVGCGSGFCSKNLSLFFEDSKILGIDIDDISINFCEKYNSGSGITYRKESIVTFNTNNKFDYIFLIETLEHIKHEHHYNIINNLLNMLTQDGKIFICTPNEDDFSSEERGHVGILTNYYFNKFRKKYKKYRFIEIYR